MNKRIEELIVQAGDYVNKTYTGPVPATFAGYLVRYEDEDCDKWKLFSEKFAELIVQECISTVQKRYMGDNNREDMEVRRCVADMKKHFGVEK